MVLSHFKRELPRSGRAEEVSLRRWPELGAQGWDGANQAEGYLHSGDQGLEAGVAGVEEEVREAAVKGGQRDGRAEPANQGAFLHP